MNTRYSFARSTFLPIVLISALLMVSCQPMLVENPTTLADVSSQPQEPSQETTIPGPETITISPDPVSGGIVVSYETVHGNGQSMHPVDTVLYSNDWATMIADERYQELRNQQGCIELMLVKPNSGVGPVSLAYSHPAESSAITPTIWSEYSVFDRLVMDPQQEAHQRVTVVSSDIAIDSAIPITPAIPCDSRLVSNELSRWKQQSGLQPNDLDGLLVNTKQVGGDYARTLILIDPQGGASCSAAVTVCSRCSNCGRQFICNVVNRIRSWIC